MGLQLDVANQQAQKSYGSWFPSTHFWGRKSLFPAKGANALKLLHPLLSSPQKYSARHAIGAPSFRQHGTEVQEHWHTKDGCKSHQDRCLTAALDLPDLLQRTHHRTVCHGLAKGIQTPPSELLSYLWNSAKCHSSLRNWKGKFTRSHPFFCRFAFALVSEPWVLGPQL